MECPQCKADVPENEYCDQCMHRLSSPGVCRGCGQANRLEAKCCGFCGNPSIIAASGFVSISDKKDPASGLPFKIRCEKDGSELVLIPAGEFLMGSDGGKAIKGERPRHKVHVDAFYLDTLPVTVERYYKFCAKTGRKMPEQPDWYMSSHPVVGVTWYEARAYSDWVGKRLPTEAEWEKAARGGTETQYHFGDDASKLSEYAWFFGNSDGETHPVGMKKPNQFGLYDMHGNVWEWVQDWHHDSYNGAPNDGSAWESPKGSARMFRGGSWRGDAGDLRSANRCYFDVPGDRGSLLGFRPAWRGQ